MHAGAQYISGAKSRQRVFVTRNAACTSPMVSEKPWFENNDWRSLFAPCANRMASYDP
jgi:hypothetical protein